MQFVMRFFKSVTAGVVLIAVWQFYGCASFIQERESAEKHFFRDSSIVEIPIAEFMQLKNSEIGDPLYTGFGKLLYSNVRGNRGLMLFGVEFKRVCFSPAENKLYVEGHLTHIEYNPPHYRAQIIMGRAPIQLSEADSASIGIVKYTIIEHSYLIPENGRFKAVLPLHSFSIMMVTSREIYSDEGDYEGTIMAPVYTFDVYKLLKKYSYEKP